MEEVKTLNIINLSDEDTELYYDKKAQVFEFAEQAKEKLKQCIKWRKLQEDQMKFFEFIINKAQFDDSFNLYLKKVQKGYEEVKQRFEESYETIEQLEKIVADYDEVIEKYFTEEIVENGAKVHPTTIEYLKIANKIIILR